MADEIFMRQLDDLCADFGASYEEVGEEEEDAAPILPGDEVELNGLVYQVFSIDATGRLVLDLGQEAIH